MTRRFFYVSLGVLCLVTAYQVGASRALGQSDEVLSLVTARQFRVVDGEGRLLVALGMAEVGGAVATYDGHGNVAVALGTTLNGEGTVTTFDGKGNKVISLGTGVEGGCSITAFNRAGGVRAQWP